MESGFSMSSVCQAHTRSKAIRCARTGSGCSGSGSGMRRAENPRELPGSARLGKHGQGLGTGWKSIQKPFTGQLECSK